MPLIQPQVAALSVVRLLDPAGSVSVAGPLGDFESVLLETGDDRAGPPFLEKEDQAESGVPEDTTLFATPDPVVAEVPPSRRLQSFDPAMSVAPNKPDRANDPSVPISRFTQKSVLEGESFTMPVGASDEPNANSPASDLVSIDAVAPSTDTEISVSKQADVPPQDSDTVGIQTRPPVQGSSIGGAAKLNAPLAFVADSATADNPRPADAPIASPLPQPRTVHPRAPTKPKGEGHEDLVKEGVRKNLPPKQQVTNDADLPSAKLQLMQMSGPEEGDLELPSPEVFKDPIKPFEKQGFVLSPKSEIPASSPLGVDPQMGLIAPNGANLAQPPKTDRYRPMIARQVTEQLTAKIQTMPNGATEVRLDPEELGRVRMVMQSHDTQMTLIVQAERPETTALLRRHIDQLVQDVRAMGYEQVTVDFGDHGEQQRHPSAAVPDPAERGAGPESGMASIESAPDVISKVPLPTLGASGLNLRL